MWNPSLVQHFDWPHLLGYHLNLAPQAMTQAAEIARIHPTSPECVWAGDPGVPATIRVNVAEDGSYESVPNPDGPQPYDTVFLLFVDEAEARACLPELWFKPEALGSA